MAHQLDRLNAALGDRYTIERELGAGGMANVYLAEDLKHGRKVAIKVLRLELAAVLGTDRFLREIEIAGRLTNPHILPLHDSGEADDTLYYVMPYVPGPTLRARLADGPLPIDEAIEVTKAVGQALDYAHREGVVHRDIKPENILLHDGTAVVADFGIAMAVSGVGGQRLTQTGLSIGTPQYMSPEQASGERTVDARSDVYALGAVLYEMLTGEPPHTGPSARAVIAKVIAEAPTPPSVVRGNLPPAVEQAVLKALSKEPADRFATAGALVSALGSGVVSEGYTPAVRVTTRWPLGIIAAVLAVAVAIGISRVGGESNLDQRRVFVAAFANETGEPSLGHVGKIAADWLARALQQTGMVEVIDPRASVFNDAPGDSIQNRDGARVTAEAAGAGLILRGSYFVASDSIRFQARVTETLTGRIVGTVPAVAAALDNPLTTALLQGTLAAVATAIGAEGVHQALTPPSSYAAYREYVNGIEAYGQLRLAEAATRFYRATVLDSTFVAPALYNVPGLWIIGRVAEADSLAEAINEKRDALTIVERHVLDSFRSLIGGGWDRAHSEMERAHKLTPGVAELTYSAGLFALWTNRPRRGRDLMTSVDPTTTFIRYGWRDYWNRVTQASHHLGEHGRELEDATRGIAQFGSNARLLNTQLRAVAAQGRIEEMERLLETWSTREYIVPVEAASLRRVAVRELGAHEHLAAAEAQLERALAWFRQLPADAWDDLEIRLEFGFALSHSGEHDEAATVFKQLTQSAPNRLEPLGMLGVVAAKQGQMATVEEVITSLEARDDPYLYGRPALWLARIYAALGRDDDAVRQLLSATAQGAVFRLSYHRDPELLTLRGHPRFAEFIREREYLAKTGT